MKNISKKLFIILITFLFIKYPLLFGMEKVVQHCKLIGHTQPVNDLTFSPAGGFAITTAMDGTLKNWNIQTGEQIQSILNYAPILKINLNPKNSTLIGATQKYGVAEIFDIVSNQCLFTTQNQGNLHVTDFIWSPDGSIFALIYLSKNSLGFIQSSTSIYSIQGLQITGPYVFDGAKSISFDKDNSFAISYQNSNLVEIYQLQHKILFSQKPALSHESLFLLKRFTMQNETNAASISSKRQKLLILSDNYSHLEFKDLSTLRRSRSPNANTHLKATTSSSNFVAWSPNETFIAQPTSNYRHINPYFIAINIWGVKPENQLEQLCVLFEQGAYLLKLEWSPNSKYLATTSTNNTSTIWKIDAPLDKPSNTKSIFKINESFLAWSRDSRYFATTSYSDQLSAQSNAITIWKLN